MLRKKVNLRLQHNGTLKVLNSKGITGLLITELNGEVIASVVGKKVKAFDSIYQAMIGVEWLNAMCMSVANPKVTMTTQDDESIHAGDVMEEINEPQLVEDDKTNT